MRGDSNNGGDAMLAMNICTAATTTTAGEALYWQWARTSMVIATMMTTETAMCACGDGNGGGGPMLAMKAHCNSDSKAGAALLMGMCRGRCHTGNWQ